jgi:hypothetical protein
MGAISIETIAKELMLACRQLGHVVSEALANLIVSTVVNGQIGCFYTERPIDESDARTVVEEAARRILSKEQPGIATLRMQAGYESAFSEIETESRKQRNTAKSAEDKALSWISGFKASFDQDFDTLSPLYKKIYQFLLLRCTSALPSATPPKDQNIDREVAAALESVFPRVGLRSFVALTGSEKAAQLQELAGIVLGIRLFNAHQKKGGTGLASVEEAAGRLQLAELLERLQKEVEEVGDICKAHADAVISAKGKKDGAWEKPPTEEELERIRNDLLFLRQYLCYLLNLQEDLSGSVERLQRDQKTLAEDLIDITALVGGRVSVPKEQVYPRFDGLARSYRAAWQEVKALEARAKLLGVLTGLRQQYFPQLSGPAQAAVKGLAARGESPGLDDGNEEPVDLEAIPGPGGQEGADIAVRLTVDNAPNFLQLELDFQGFCIHTLVSHGSLLVPGDPALGVVRYAGRYCVFATERALQDFCAEPDKYFGSVREVCYKHPELIHLLRIHEDFPKSSLLAIIQQTAGSQAVSQADAGTETELHPVESNIDKSYEWNEWSLRREALHMADIRQKSTSATQTVNSHMRRENETQVYLPKEVATNTAVNRGTNPPRFQKYYRGLRGEPQQMTVTELRFDL